MNTCRNIFIVAITFYSQRKFVQALKAFNSVRAEKIKNKMFLYGKAKTLFELNKLHEALEIFIFLQKKISKKTSKQLALDIYNEKGRIFTKFKKYNHALKCFNKAIEFDPNCFYPHFNKANVYFYLERHIVSSKCYNECIRLNPSFYSAYYNKGCLMKKYKIYESALQCFNMCIKLKPSTLKGHYLKGSVLEKLKKLKEASDCFNDCIKLDSLDLKSYFKLANVLYERHRFTEALEIYDKMIPIINVNVNLNIETDYNLYAMQNLEIARAIVLRSTNK